MKIKQIQKDIKELKEAVIALRDNLNGLPSRCGCSFKEGGYTLYIRTWIEGRIELIEDEIISHKFGKVLK